MLPPVTKSPRAKKSKVPNINQQTFINRNNNVSSCSAPNILKDLNLKPDLTNENIELMKESNLLPLENDKSYNTCYSTKLVNPIGFNEMDPVPGVSGIPVKCSDIALNLADKPLKEQINLINTCTNLVDDKTDYIMPMNLSNDNLTGTNINCDTINIKDETQDLGVFNRRKNIRKCNNARKRKNTLSRRFSSGDLISRNNYVTNNTLDIPIKDNLGNITNSESSPNLLFNPPANVMSPKLNNIPSKTSTCISNTFNFNPSDIQNNVLELNEQETVYSNVMDSNNQVLTHLPSEVKEEFTTNLLGKNNPTIIPEIITESVIDCVDEDVKIKIEQDETSNQNTLDILPTEIPRERVISICNLDKDALDGYLHGGDNSQEQEEELLQYFQQDSSSKSEQPDIKMEDKLNLDSTLSDKFDQDIKSDMNIPLHNVGNKTAQDRLSQLRSLLEKNMQNMKSEFNDRPPTYIKKYSQAVQDNLNFRQISASESLAMLSQRQNNNLLKPLPNSKINNGLSARRHVSFDSNPVSAMKDEFPQSPTTRRKNCSFMPIPSSPLSPHTKTGIGNTSPKAGSCNASPFVSPRSTPALRHRSMFDKLMKSNKNIQTGKLYLIFPLALTILSTDMIFSQQLLIIV